MQFHLCLKLLIGNFVNTDSVIENGTIEAYEETNYFVQGSSPLTLNIGVKNHYLADLHKANGVESSAFITAWNPYSKPFDKKENKNFQAVLVKELTILSLPIIEGVGQHPSNKWPCEESFLVLGISLEAAKILGIKYQQNAIIWNDSGATPQLILLR